MASQGRWVLRAGRSHFLTLQEVFQVWALPTCTFLALFPVTKAVEAGEVRSSLGQDGQAEGGGSAG